MKVKKLIKFISFSLIVSILCNLSPSIVFADITPIDQSTPIGFDHWKNGNGWANIVDATGKTVDVNGSGVEYNGLRIVRATGTLGTVYCKSGDVLGVTSWTKVINLDTYGLKYGPQNDYLVLSRDSNNYDVFNSKIEFNSTASHFSTLAANDSTLSLLSDSTLGTSINSDGNNAYGHLYYVQFGNNGDYSNNGYAYNIMSDENNYEGDWIYPIEGDVTNPENWSGRTISQEKIQVYDNKPITNVTSNVNGSLATINISVADATVGVQKYTYTITAPGGTVTTKTVNATDQGNDQSQFYGTFYTPSEIGQHNGSGNSEFGGTNGAAETLTHPAYTLTTNASVSGTGIYHVSVSAINNLGFKDDSSYNGDIAVGTPTPPSAGAGKGTITFVPNSTSWTNIGKIAGFPVKVVTTNQQVQETWIQHYTRTATTTITNADKSTSTSTSTSNADLTVPFKVTYTLGNLNILGNCSPLSLPNTGGQILIKEGANSIINATGSYSITNKETPVQPPTPGSFVFGNSTTTYSISPANLEKPSGDIADSSSISGTSGSYNVDYTNPILAIDNPSSLWVNKPVNVAINAADPPGQYNASGMSGLKSATWNKNDSSHYGKNGSNSFAGNSVITLDDGMYGISLNDSDVVGNTNSTARSTYYVDTTAPTASFSVTNASPSRIFQGDGVTRKASIKGTGDGLYGKLTLADNLSGVAKTDYCWTYSSSDAGGTYSNIYTSPYTYTDRNTEKINLDIEKPVGDNLYLHVKEYDMAGNYTYSTWGPYEDPIALKNFEVTDVHDPSWEGVFYKDLAFTQTTGRTFKANELPLDDTSNSVYKNADIKKGYAFNFDITSEYMYRDNDRIEVKPFFYYTDGKSRVPVDCYYNSNNNPFTLVGSSSDTLRLNLDTTKYGSVLIGGLSKLTLTRGVRIVDGKEFYGTNGWQNKSQYSDGKTQWWYGKYYIPSNAVFVKHGDSPTPNNVLSDNHVIVNFQIIGYKNGIETLSQDQMYNYVDNNWVAEGGPKNASYQNGDVMVYNNSKSVLDDYTSHIIQ